MFVSAAAWEDFGIAPLEALDRGAALVGAPGGGPFPGLAIARSLAPSFVAEDRDAASLARALEAAFAADDAVLAAYRGGRAPRARALPARGVGQAPSGRGAAGAARRVDLGRARAASPAGRDQDRARERLDLDAVGLAVDRVALGGHAPAEIGV